MRAAITICLGLFVIATPVPAAADCTADIAKLLQGGPWDPFVRKNRRETTVLRHADGSTSPYSDVLWDGPIRSINCTPNGCFMAIGNASWSGSSFEGPWKSNGNIKNIDPETFVRNTMDRLAASVEKAECPGEVDLDGKQTVLYKFFSKPEPNEHGSWWGGNYSVWIDAKANQLLRIELADGIASWAPKPSKDVQVTTVVYDEAIKIEEPK